MYFNFIYQKINHKNIQILPPINQTSTQIKNKIVFIVDNAITNIFIFLLYFEISFNVILLLDDNNNN
jgi:hypothetical protein